MRTARARQESENGAILVIVTAAMVVLIGMIAIAIDLSYGFVQNRRAQNATDFAAFAASQQLNSSTYCNGTGVPSMQQITTIIQELVDDNDASVGSAWNAQFVNSAGHVLPGSTFTPTAYPADPPPGACGVSISAAPAWPTFFSGLFGIHQLKGYAASSVSTSQTGQPIGIIALNKAGPHEILGGGTGTFVVAGNMFLNTDVTNQPWTGPAGGWEWDDAVDAKVDSNLYVYGTIDTDNGTYDGEPLWPLDTCFQPSILGEGTDTSPAYAAGDPDTQKPAQQMSCSEWGSSVTIDYDSIDPQAAQISDPVQGTGAPPDPLNPSTDIACPGMGTSPQVNPTPLQVGTTTYLLPGEYTNAIKLTGSVVFDDCHGYQGEEAYPGIYRFDDGLWIDPQAGDTVTGSNVVIATGTAYPLAGNVPGTLNGATFTATGPGNGAPCLPSSTMTSAPSGHGTPEPETSTSACSGTSPTTYGVVAYGDSTFVPDNTMSGTGNNFSLIIGGAGTVNLAGPTSGPYTGTNGAPGLVFYQDPTIQANYGFNAEPGDSANITITGAVYNASLSNFGSNAPLDYWDGVGGGIPFYAGGTLQTGYGAGWSNGPPESSGSVTLNGTAIVDDFNTDGTTAITILGQPYTLPGGGHLSLIG